MRIELHRDVWMNHTGGRWHEYYMNLGSWVFWIRPTAFGLCCIGFSRWEGEYRELRVPAPWRKDD